MAQGKFRLKDMVQGRVQFRFYRDRSLYYETANGVLFPVPIEDVGTATFLAEDKGILFMRYMRQFLESLPPVGITDSEHEQPTH